MDFSKFVMKKDTYSLASIHPIFAYKCILAIMYWLGDMGIEYKKTEEDGNMQVEINNGVTITTEDVGNYLCFECPDSHPTKINIYRYDKCVMLCSSDDELDETYMYRFAPGLYTLIGHYNTLEGFNRYVVCDDDVKIMLDKWINIDNRERERADVLFVVGKYNMKEIAKDVMFGKELVIFEYEVDPGESLTLAKADIVMTIENGNIVVNGIIETI